MQPNMYGTKSMHVVKFIVQETGTYNTQFARPYQTNLDGASKSAILETVDRQKSITPTALAGIANGFISPLATPESEILIPNGWSEKRLKFMLEVMTEDRTGMMKTTEFITGYTDHAGLSFGGQVDPHMPFIINGVNVTRTQIQNTPLGNQVHHNLIDSSHILINSQYKGITHADQMYSLRPEDVFDQIDNRELASNLNDGFIVDGRTKINGNATKSKRSNSVAPVYMANTLDAYLQTARAQRNESSNVILQTAKSSVESDSISSDPFMSFMRQLNHQQGTNTFTLNNLIQMDPNTLNVMHVIPMTPQLAQTVHQAGQTAGWGAADSETLWATTLSQAVPGYMIQFGFNKIHFLSTNADTGGHVHTRIVGAKSFTTNADMSRELQALIFSLENQLLKSLSFNNQRGFQVDMVCDLLGETIVQVSLDGAAPVPYVTPSFADALMAPVVTHNYGILDGVASDFDALMTDIYENDSSYGVAGSMKTGLI